MNITAQYRIQIERAIRTGLQILRKAEPLRLSEWADQNFYLVAESSYIEGLWETLPHQRAIMDCISNDDIRSVTVRKSARVGYTKIIVAAVGYFAEHKRRNQVLFQPVDQDAEDFTKDEIDPMVRDVPAVQKVFPYFNTKSKFNTLTKKVFRGSTLDIRGGKAAKNYRRLSKDVVYYDELEGFDGDIEGEGDPVSLGDKRTEGATFPKSIRGSTPGLAETSLILRCERAANERFTWHAPCPHCDLMQQIVWGGRDSSCGLKWDAGDAKSVQYLCEGCACLFPFEAYLLESYPKGRYISESGMWIDDVGLFRSPSGEIVDTPEHVALSIWTGAAAQVPWHRIVADFFEAKKSPGTLKTFVNTTLGEAWAEKEGDKVDSEVLAMRREPYTQPPEGVLMVLMTVDTQDDRLEVEFIGFGKGDESWGLDRLALRGNPGEPELWNRLTDQFARTFTRADGAVLTVTACSIDSAGHFTKQVYDWCKKHRGRAWPLIGRSGKGRPLVSMSQSLLKQHGLRLMVVGTDTATELVLLSRVKITQPGPGYCHWPASYSDDYFTQLTSEERKVRYTNGHPVHVWVLPKGRRNEALDQFKYALALLALLRPNFDALAERMKPGGEKPIPPRPRVAHSNYLRR